MNDTSTAHANDPSARGFYPDGNAPWRAATPPDLSSGRTVGGLRSCQYCGSMHPADLAVAIRAGARGHFADQKYGWPHKAYFDAIPNPHVGLLESRFSTSHATPICPKTKALCESGERQANKNRCGCDIEGTTTTGVANGKSMVKVPDGFDRVTGAPVTRWIAAGEPAPATTSGKFYTVHLQDASPEDRETIESHLGVSFTFDGRDVAWGPVILDAS